MMLPDSIPSYVQDFLNAFEDMVEYLKGGDQIIAQMEEELRYTHIFKLKITWPFYSLFVFSYGTLFNEYRALRQRCFAALITDLTIA